MITRLNSIVAKSTLPLENPIANHAHVAFPDIAFALFNSHRSVYFNAYGLFVIGLTT